MHCCRPGNVQELDHRMGILVVADMKFCMYSAKFSLRARPILSLAGSPKLPASKRMGLARELVWLAILANNRKAETRHNGKLDIHECRPRSIEMIL